MALLSLRASAEKNLSEFRKMLPGDLDKMKLTPEGLQMYRDNWDRYIKPTIERQLKDLS